MNPRSLIAFFLLALPFAVAAQQKPSCSCGVRGVLSSGILAGQSPVKPLFQVSAGLSRGKYFTGAGIGIDPYRFQSIPLFADLRLITGKYQNGFLYAHGGYNFPYNNTVSIDNVKTTDRYQGGFYFDAGAGYRIVLQRSHLLLLSAGFSQKQITHVEGYTYPCLVAPCIEDVHRYRYTLGRMVAKLSWEFGSSLR